MLDTTIIDQFFKDEDFSQHWLFFNIVEGEYTFEYPQIEKGKLKCYFDFFLEELRSFEPNKPDFFAKYFPDWKEELNSSFDIVLSAGSPYPYDAMTREKGGKLVLIFDLNRLYTDDLEAASIQIRQLITHELFHALYEKSYPADTRNFKDELLRLTFNEGFAHFLAVGEEILADLESFSEQHYERNLKRLLKALEEDDPDVQNQIMQECNAGSFFEKYASVTGLFILCHNEDRMDEIFEEGYSRFLKGID